MMSDKRWAGFLEGIDCVAQNVASEERLQRPAIHNVTRAIEELANVKFQPGILKNADRARFVEFDQHVDVALLTGFASRDRTEHRGVRNAKLAQIGLVSAENFERVVEGYRHGS
jgi:hypothetical protein